MTYDIIIAGGGIVGLCAALAARRLDLSVAIVDAKPISIDLSTTDQRVYAINQASKSLLEQLDVWQHIPKSERVIYRNMHVWEAQSNAHIDFDCRSLALPALGYMISDASLKQALIKCIHGSHGVDLFQEQAIESLIVNDDCVSIHTTKQSISGRHLLIADGGRSRCAELLGVTSTSWPYQQDALVMSVTCEKPHQNTAWQVFLDDGTLAFLPLPDEYQCSIVWSLPPESADRIFNMSDDALAQCLAETFSNKLGTINHIGTRQRFPLTMRQAKQYSQPQWTMMGDAAHSIHPMAGLGLNLGLADVAFWLDIKSTSNDTWGKKQAGLYQRQRRTDSWTMIMMLEALKQVFTHSSPMVKSIRGLGFSLVNQMDLMKRLFIGKAQG